MSHEAQTFAFPTARRLGIRRSKRAKFAARMPSARHNEGQRHCRGRIITFIISEVSDTDVQCHRVRHRSARDGLVEHWPHLHEHIATAAFRHAVATRELAEQGCFFTGLGGASRELLSDVAPSRKFSERLQAAGTSIAQHFADTLARVTARLDAVPPDEFFVADAE